MNHQDRGGQGETHIYSLDAEVQMDQGDWLKVTQEVCGKGTDLDQRPQFHFSPHPTGVDN